MKFKLPLWLCIVLAAALVAFGLAYGTVQGFLDERAQADALLNGQNGLMDVLAYRGADGLNLCVVARRHLARDDADVAALEAAARALKGAGTLEDKRAADERLEAAVHTVADRLRAAPSFQAAARDVNYLDMLEADLRALGASAAVSAYNEAAAAFNDLLQGSVAGALARFLGVAPCALYE